MKSNHFAVCCFAKNIEGYEQEHLFLLNLQQLIKKKTFGK